MKLNLEVELDYIDEEMNLDETIKQNIINTITSRIETKISDKVKQTVEDKIDKLIVAKIDEMTTNLFSEFIARPVILTDGYGGKLKQYENVEAIVKEKFDNFLIERVDEKGNKSTYASDNKFHRVEFIINKQMKDFADKFTNDAVKKVSAEIQEHVKHGLTQKLGAELMKVLKVEQMLKLS